LRFSLGAWWLLLLLLLLSTLRQCSLPVKAFSVASSSSPGRNRNTAVRTLSSSHLFQSLSNTPDAAVHVAESVQPSVVLVTPKGVRNMTARGSGFILKQEDVPDAVVLAAKRKNDDGGTYIITSAHVALPGYSIEIARPSANFSDRTANPMPATVVARNATLDLALLWTKESLSDEDSGIGLTLCQNVPPVGTLAFAHGHPASRLRGPAMTSGIVCGVADGLGVPDDYDDQRPQRQPTSNNDATIFVVTDAAMSGGMSGGPLVDSTGAVLGVNALIRPDLRALGNYAVSSLEVLNFLKSIPLLESSKENVSEVGKFQIWLYNDPMNKKARVSGILNSVASLDGDKANEVMMEAHSTGRGMVGQYKDQATAESIYRSLREQDLLVEME